MVLFVFASAELATRKHKTRKKTRKNHSVRALLSCFEDHRGLDSKQVWPAYLDGLTHIAAAEQRLDLGGSFVAKAILMKGK